MQLALNDQRTLLGLIWSLKPSDYSVLVSSLKKDDSKIMTTAGSGNEVFYSRLVQWRLANALQAPAKPESVPSPQREILQGMSRMYQLSETGRLVLPPLIRKTMDTADIEGYLRDMAISDDALKMLRIYDSEHDISSQEKFGILYRIGLGVPKDPIQSFKWYVKAADHGSAGAMDTVAHAYFEGPAAGVDQNEVEGFRWLERSANFGYIPARARVARLYATGKGTNRNLVKAYMWLSLAIAGKDDVVKERDAIADQMSPSEIKEGNKLVASWRPSDWEAIQRNHKLKTLLMSAVADEKGMHIETVLVLMGALIGFAAQMVLREMFIVPGKATEDQLFKTVKGADGFNYYTGDILLESLLRMTEGHTSLRTVLLYRVKNFGAKEFPDSLELIRQVESNYGGPGYGVIRVPAQHMPKFLPFDMLKDCWDAVEVFLRFWGRKDPNSWLRMLTGALEQFVVDTQGKMDPNFIMPLVLQAALAMSHIDPSRVCGMGGESTVNIARSELGKRLQMDATAKKKKAAAATRH